MAGSYIAPIARFSLLEQKLFQVALIGSLL
jgi:hypothetical protein